MIKPVKNTSELSIATPYIQTKAPYVAANISIILCLLQPRALIIRMALDWYLRTESADAIMYCVVGCEGYQDEILRIENRRVSVKDLFRGEGVNVMDLPSRKYRIAVESKVVSPVPYDYTTA